MASTQTSSLQQIKQSLKRLLGKSSSPQPMLNVAPPLPLPAGVSEAELKEFLMSVVVSDAPIEEMRNYCQGDFRRFVYTYGLTQGLQGKCLELGANPYFTTMLLETFTDLELSYANYFGSGNTVSEQDVNYVDFKTKQSQVKRFAFKHFNSEGETFPYADHTFDIVIFCEILEHMTENPIASLQEIKRILKPNATLILSTPNVSRLENVARMVAGVNIYDPYSGYGPHGRHNREYNRHELALLLDYVGFDIEIMYTADVHPDFASSYQGMSAIAPLVEHRHADLGQYLFVRAINRRESRTKKPSFLYRSYPAGEIEPWG
jgi:SAM-dependent methyltransferase